MKIGIDIRTLMEKSYSGVSEYTFNLVKAILEEDSENEYKLFYNSGRDVKDRLPVFNYKNVEVVSCRYPNKIFNYFLQKIFRYPKIDKILGVDIFWMPHINFISLSKQSKKILTVHDLSFLRYRNFFNLRRNIWHSIINVKNLTGDADEIVTVSENTKNDLIELAGVNADKIDVVYSGLDEQYKIISKDDKNLSRIREKYILKDEFILFLGNLEPRKNIRGLIKAYNKFRKENFWAENIDLVIAGGVGWKARDIFKEKKKSEYKNDIKFLEYIPREEKVYLYNLASVFVYPSFYEGFGFPPLEAMACGIPVIASSVSSLPEVAGGQSFLVNPDSSEEISEAMKIIFSNKKVRDRLIKAGIEKVAELSWKKTAAKYLNIFQKMN
jgi:glycosyltransferase involved in cell wall biosynthesis